MRGAVVQAHSEVPLSRRASRETAVDQAEKSQTSGELRGATSATPQHVCGSGVLLGWEPLVIDVVGWNPQGRFDDDSPFSQGEIS